ncbi:Putative ATP-binding protein [Acinetobacter baumannii]|nr:Putative ATP-binding protein [Acinetobacter baumannii]
MLGRLPLNAQIREHADQGKPSVVAMDDAADSYIDIAKAVWQQIKKIPQRARDDKRIF